jgi:hypothetical protein
MDRSAKLAKRLASHDICDRMEHPTKAWLIRQTTPQPGGGAPITLYWAASYAKESEALQAARATSGALENTMAIVRELTKGETEALGLNEAQVKTMEKDSVDPSAF